jgi:mannan endo-1,4-beta-mannosidase
VTQPTLEPNAHWGNHRRPQRTRRRISPMVYGAAAVGIAIIITAMLVPNALHRSSARSAQPEQSVPYLGVFEPDAPGSYAGVNHFAQAIGRQPNVVLYYSHWFQPFNIRFASAAAKHGAVTVVQIAPQNIPLSNIVSGRYDAYLRSYATAVKAFRNRVVLSFGHEMNGTWYPWSYKHTRPAIFVAAWRHIVTVFRGQGTKNVTWMWTVNVIGRQDRIPEPSPWWPGKSYVDWVGIDGYYWSPSLGFASLFGPTIADVRRLTSDPILIAETGAEPSSGQSAKIADLFAGVSTFGLLGFVYFNDDVFSAAIPDEALNWRLSSPAAIAAFRSAVKAFMKPSANSSDTTAEDP